MQHNSFYGTLTRLTHIPQKLFSTHPKLHNALTQCIAQKTKISWNKAYTCLRVHTEGALEQVIQLF
jgi:hypothetical protein